MRGPDVTPEQLAEIEARAEAATPGPWEPAAHSHGADGCRCLSHDDEPVGWLIETPASLDCGELTAKKNASGKKNDFNREFSSCDDLSPLMTYADAEFFASARTDVPALVAEIRRLRAALGAAQ